MPPVPRILRYAGAVAFVLMLAARGSADELPWKRSPWFEEQIFTASLEPAVRYHVSAPLDDAGKPAKATRIIIYALPNGNTIEQTLGCRMAEGMDWHFDIQHVAAQVRMLRSLAPHESILLICAEAGGLSWPNWRRTQSEANARIAQLVDDWRRDFGAEGCKVLLTGHSGGGSFLLGVIEGNEEIPEYIDRIAFLDANYSFDAAIHNAKLEHWLTGDDSRRLIVLAYDDREITLDGKKVVGPTGGTFRATGRMRDALGKRFELAESTSPPFQETTGLDGRIRFYVHPNPENKILHTALVGEMNGLAHVATLGTNDEEKWGKFGGPRAYTKWVQPAPASSVPSAARDGALPSRPPDAVGGCEFVKRLQGLSLDERETAILQEITRGNFPGFLRKFKAVPLRATLKNDHGDKEIDIVLEVMPDYLAVGSDDDFVRMPMTPQTAQRIADDFGCVLPTRKIVDAIDAAAEIHVAPHPLTREREAVATFQQHHEIIERQRAAKPLGLLISGIKKDIVLTPRIFERPERLAIYGWRKLDGEPIQPLTIVHWNRYVDYSHGARLVRDAIAVEGQPTKLSDLLADPARWNLVSDEGPMEPPRYPLD